MATQTKTSNNTLIVLENRNRMRQNLIKNLKFKNLTKQTDQINTAESLSKNFKLKYKLSIFDSFEEQVNNKSIIQQKITYDEFQKKYQLQNKIGEGAHSIVYKCQNIQTKQIKAVKITKHTDIESLESLKTQFCVIKSLKNHQLIIHANQFFVDQISMKTFFVMEYYPHKDLRTFIQNNRVTQDLALIIIQKISQAIKYLHQKGVCHRDIKPQNILWDQNKKEIKLIDFDICKMKKDGQQKHQMWTNTGSLSYRAPQSFRGGYTQKVDLWSLGVIAFQLMTGRLPFQSAYEHQVIKKICNQKLDLDNQRISDQKKKIITHLLQKSPIQRMSIEQIQSFFNKQNHQEQIN